MLTHRLWKEFTPKEREKDGLVLSHWVKKGSVEDENGTYYFDQFDVKVDVPTYTEEEYENWLKGIELPEMLEI